MTTDASGTPATPPATGEQPPGQEPGTPPPPGDNGATGEVDIRAVEEKWKQDNPGTELPSWVRDAISRANREAAAHRVKVRELEPLAQEARALKDAQRTEAERLTERLTTAETGAANAVRYEVALDKGLTKSQAKRLVGATYDELAADADVLLADLRASGGGNTTPPVGGPPTERLIPGAGDPSAPPEETDVRKLAERMFSH